MYWNNSNIFPNNNFPDIHQSNALRLINYYLSNNEGIPHQPMFHLKWTIFTHQYNWFSSSSRHALPATYLYHYFWHRTYLSEISAKRPISHRITCVIMRLKKRSIQTRNKKKFDQIYYLSSPSSTLCNVISKWSGQQYDNKLIKTSNIIKFHSWVRFSLEIFVQFNQWTGHLKDPTKFHSKQNMAQVSIWLLYPFTSLFGYV